MPTATIDLTRSRVYITAVFRLSLFALLLLATAAFAQNGTPAAEANLPQTVRLQYPNADINTILDLYESLTRKRLIRPNQVLAGQVYIVINEELPREEAIKIIEATLLANGFSLVPSPDGKMVKVFGNGVNPRPGGIPIIADETQLPDRDQVVTYLFKLKNADPTDVAQVITGFLQSGGPANYTSSIVPLPKSQALLVTENATIIRGLIKLVNEIDLPPADVISEFITLQRADAKEVLEKLEKLFEKPTATGTPTAPGNRPAAPRATPDGTPVPPGATAENVGGNMVEINGGTALSEDSLIIGKIRLTADVRTNRIHVVTRPKNMPFIRSLLKEFDKDVPFGEPAERSLKFVTAADVLESVVKAIQDPGAKDATSTGLGTSGGNQASQQGQNNRGFGSNNSFGNTSGFGGGTGGSQGFSEELSTAPVDTVPKAVTVGNTRIIADTRSNKIIVLGNKEVRDKIFKLLDHLDQRAPQVMLQTVIGQLELGNKEQFGVDYILKKGGNIGFFPTNGSTTGGTTGTTGTTTGNTTAANPTGSGTAVSINGTAPVLNLANLLTQRDITQIAVAGATGLQGFFTAGNTLDAIVTALESTNRFKVSARPQVFTSNNKKALIASGQEIAIPATTLSSLNQTNVNQDNAAVSSTIQFKRVALQLEVVPLINSDREVTLDILQKVDDISGSTRVGGNDIPTISTRIIKTTVSVPNESTLVLGGLIQMTDNKSVSGIPYLSRIPLLGNLFRFTGKDKTRRELVILIRPVVSMGPKEATAIRERSQEYLNLEPDLEGTFMPPGIRSKGPAPAPALRQPPVPVLREEPLAK